MSTANYTLDYTVRLTDIPSTSVAGLGVGDLDNDGRSELVASHGGWVFGKAPPVTSILSFNGSGYEEKGRIENLTMVVWPGLMFQGVAHVVIKDADNDGENELLVPGLFGTERGVHLFEHTAVGFLHSWSVVGEDVEVFDLDGDGSNEIAVPGSGVFRHSGGKYERVAALPGGMGVRIGDLDGDAYPEILIARDEIGQDIEFEVVDWNGGSPTSRALVGHSGFALTGFGLGDSDGDGNAEVFLVEYHRHIAVYGWEKDSMKVEWEGFAPDFDNPTAGWVGDADGDGISELFVGNGNNDTGNNVLQYEFDGVGYALTWDSSHLPNLCHSITTGDADSDGVPELIAGAGETGRVWVFSPVLQGIRPPSAPRNASAAAGDGRVAVWWSPPEDTGGAGVTGYEVLRREGGSQEAKVANVTGRLLFIDAGVTNGVQYQYRIVAYNLAGSGLPSLPVTATPSGEAPPPRVVQTTPRDGETGTDPFVVPVVGFDSYMERESTQASVQIEPRARDLRAVSLGELLELRHRIAFVHSTKYTVTIRDSASNAVGVKLQSAVSFSFTTASPPTGVPGATISPPDGATDVPLDVKILFRFTEPMDERATLDAISIDPPIDFGITWQDEGRVLVASPMTKLDPFTSYNVTVGKNAKSSKGVGLWYEAISGFKTGNKLLEPVSPLVMWALIAGSVVVGIAIAIVVASRTGLRRRIRPVESSSEAGSRIVNSDSAPVPASAQPSTTVARETSPASPPR